MITSDHQLARVEEESRSSKPWRRAVCTCDYQSPWTSLDSSLLTYWASHRLSTETEWFRRAYESIQDAPGGER